jgi:hypothetical protein
MPGTSVKNIEWTVVTHDRVQNDSGAHPGSYPVGTRGSSSGVKRPGREADHLTSI